MSVQKDIFLENLSLLLHAGMPIGEALQSLSEEARGRQMTKTIGKITDEIEAGGSISSALRKSGILSERFVSLLRIGEETGKLSDNLALIVSERKKEQIFRSKIQSALIYPGFVLAVTFVVGILTAWYTFPKLVAVFDNMGGTLPVTTRAIIGAGHFLGAYGAWAVPSFLIIVALLFVMLFFWKRTKIIGEWILLSLPLSKRIAEEIEVARFGYTLGTLLSAGVSFPQAFESLRDATSFIMYKRFYAKVVENITDGNSLYKSIFKVRGYERFVPSHIVRLLDAGERSGSLSATLLTISAAYEQKTDDLTRDLSALLEPAIVLFVGLLVAVVALGIISPIYGLVNQISG